MKNFTASLTHFIKRQDWMLFAFFSFMIVFIPAPSPMAQPEERTFRIEASSFEFAPHSITVNPGDRVTIELVSTDVVHGLYLDGYDLEISSDPGQTTQLSFIADKSGTFHFRCSVTCGALHPFMIGKLNVGTNLLLSRGIGLSILVVVFGIWKLCK